jgi:uncharacterized protein (DUF1697 family)
VPTWVCLLRAVNLGKQRKVPMAVLRQALTAAGMTGVRTYLQSGNVVAQSPLAAPEQVSALVRSVIAAEFSLDVPVITRRPADIDRVIAVNPFASQAAQRAHLVRVIFLADAPAAAKVEQMTSGDTLHATCRVIGDHVFVDYADGYHGAARTANFFTRALGVDGTERNWRTVCALANYCSA